MIALNKKTLGLAVLALFTILQSCRYEGETLTTQDIRYLAEEAEVDFYYQDLDDMGGVLLDAPTDAQFEGGRAATTIIIQDDRLSCNGVVITLVTDPASTKVSPKGVMTVDFGTGCKDGRGNTRKGKLIYSYSGKRYFPNSVVITTTDHYYFNDVKVSGQRTSTNISGSTSATPKFDVVMEDGVAEFTDGSSVARESHVTSEWIRSTSPLNDELIITGTAEGTNRDGSHYSVTVLDSLAYKRLCPVLVKGVKRYVWDGENQMTIDYGDGTCDRFAIITIGSASKTIIL